ncbi:hypothetical protein [uncultured Aliiroseovarius sp.]|uniref:hypothetical protein n=1 Tax=uncultured Aliiroseovarius sp. TaxID=1658783 RepID=UPI0026146E3D|nr:hypothetical protein [uncultured Aliiroseovarius sp.]
MRRILLFCFCSLLFSAPLLADDEFFELGSTMPALERYVGHPIVIKCLFNPDRQNTPRLAAPLGESYQLEIRQLDKENADFSNYKLRSHSGPIKAEFQFFVFAPRTGLEVARGSAFGTRSQSVALEFRGDDFELRTRLSHLSFGNGYFTSNQKREPLLNGVCTVFPES